MLTMIRCEFAKLRRNGVLWILLCGAAFPVFMTAVQSSITQTADGSPSSFSRFCDATVWNDFSVAFPLVIVLVGGMLADREYVDDTLKNVLTVPVSSRRLAAAKLIATGLLSVLLGITNLVLACAGALPLHLDGMSLAAVTSAALQVCATALCEFVAVSPLIAWAARKRGRYFAAAGIAFVYGFVGIFVVGRHATDAYPISAALRLAGYGGLEAGSPALALCSLAATLLVTVLLVAIKPPAYDDADAAFRRKPKTPKRTDASRRGERRPR